MKAETYGTHLVCMGSEVPMLCEGDGSEGESEAIIAKGCDIRNEMPEMRQALGIGGEVFIIR